MKSYPSELKANVVKECIEKGVSCSQLSKTYNIPTRNIYKWVKKFRDSGENYSCFFNGPFNKNSIVSRGSKIPPVVYENAGVDLDEISRLCMEYPELAQTLQALKDLVIEKDIEIKVLREQVEFVKKKFESEKMMENKHVDFKSTPILDILYINRLHREYGISLSYLFEAFNVNSRTYYYKTRLFLDTSSLSKKKHSNSKTRGFCYTVNGDKVPDEFVISELKQIKEHLNMYVSKPYLKTIGSTKLCEYFKEKYGIIINHKKMSRLKYEVGLVGKYTKH